MTYGLTTITWLVVAFLVLLLVKIGRPVVQSLWDDLQSAPAHIVARVRAGIITVGAAGLAFPHQVAEYLSWPWVEQPLKVFAVLCAGLALLLRAGEKKDKKEDQHE